MTFDGRIEAAITIPIGIGITVQTFAPATASTIVVTIAPATYAGLTAFCAYLKTALDAQKPLGGAGVWTVTLSTGASGTGLVTISASLGTFTFTWATPIQYLLGFVSAPTAVSTATGTQQARGLWIPDCPLAADSDIKQAPTATDIRSTVGPTGYVYSKRGTQRYRHTGLRWSHVAINRVWRSEETTTNQSYERFVEDCIEATSVDLSTFFSVNSAIQIYDQRGTLAGSAKSVTAWKVTAIPSLSSLRMAIADYTGLWRIEWPEIVSDA